ncbi:hypothetical protein J9305_13330 [Leptospira interrogans]|nr:hypothetical protein LEP1GSC007_0369 [Leptospira interrogans serovar Bulgarica str. Mallika]EJP17196.1 hypothetical protein LEP1GSC080_3162 [Leptospira interrogans str. FPW2026]EKR80606.1 hypothetical protein LEP1GSC099_2590 [Leptospira interrogans str. UI 08452]EMN33515.1 hypothetical protein LEP1GSC084_0977 [Leptospira interrogans serovar Medanensis str. L0448]EMN41599.1 hypothetical protein LEP1GSC085_0956 [Leptospira interrogans str. L0996]EMN67772.1 hypothetical protein LEP1GSC098_0270
MFLNKKYPDLLSNREEDEFVDLTFKIENLKEGSDNFNFNLKAKFKDDIVGFKVMMTKNIDRGFDSNMELIKQNVCYEGVKFIRTGKESDLLVSHLNDLYGFASEKLNMTDLETFTAIALTNEPFNLIEDIVKIKLFGKDQEGASEED